MDLFQHRYYRLSKILMMLIGQWPYQSTRAKRGLLAVLIFFGSIGIVPSMLAFVRYQDDATMLMECLLLYVLGTICFMKMISFMKFSQKRSKLINRIRTDWQVWARDREVNILHRYAEQGEKITIVYTAMMYLTFFVILAQPIVPNIIDVLLRNGTAPEKIPYPIVFYNIDEQKYYFYLIMYTCVCAYMLGTVIISNDVILIIYVQHACGIFAALGHKLTRNGNNDTSTEETGETGENLDELTKRDLEHLTSCIARHNDAIEYANLIETVYTRTFLITTGLGMILINAVGLQILMTISDAVTTARFILAVLAILFYFFIECYISQILMDHSISIRFYIFLLNSKRLAADPCKSLLPCRYNSQWYILPPKVQKILQFMTMRCTVPCQLTAGNMMTLSMRNFWLTLKTTISYFGVLRSTQGL